MNLRIKVLVLVLASGCELAKAVFVNVADLLAHWPRSQLGVAAGFG